MNNIKQSERVWDYLRRKKLIKKIEKEELVKNRASDIWGNPIIDLQDNEFANLDNETDNEKMEREAEDLREATWKEKKLNN